MKWYQGPTAPKTLSLGDERCLGNAQSIDGTCLLVGNNSMKSSEFSTLVTCSLFGAAAS